MSIPANARITFSRKKRILFRIADFRMTLLLMAFPGEVFGSVR
jgi:hypothetical protein